MALKKFVERLTKPVDQLDREELAEYCAGLGCTPIAEVVPRTPVRVAGEVSSVRIVPRAGAAALEVTVSDGRASLRAVFLGRRRIAGLTPGRRLVLEGVVVGGGDRTPSVYNPVYTILK